MNTRTEDCWRDALLSPKSATETPAEMWGRIACAMRGLCEELEGARKDRSAEVCGLTAHISYLEDSLARASDKVKSLRLRLKEAGVPEEAVRHED